MVLKQRPPLLVTISTAVLLILGGAAAYVGIVKRLSTGVKFPAGMELVPDDALVTLTLTTDENQWNRLRQLGTADSQKQLDQLLVTWRDRMLSANGYQFKPDIQPWIGEQVTIAFLPPQPTSNPPATDQQDPQTTDPPAADMVLVAPIADATTAQELMATPQEGSTWVGRDYKGVSIQSIKTARDETFESTVLGNQWLIVASGSPGIEAVIDSFEGGASMLENDAYLRAFKQLTTPSAAIQMYVNVPIATTALTESNNLPGINGLVAAANILPNGLDIEVSTWLGPEDAPVYRDMVNAPSMMPQRLPDSTVLMLSTGNIGPLWQALEEAERLNALLPVSSQALAKGLKTQTGLDFENDILPWLSGDVAFGLLPPSEPSESAIPMGQLALVAEVADREAAEATWAELDEVMVNRFRFNVESQEEGPQSVNQLVSYYGGIAMGHGWLEQDVTFFGIGTEVLSAIAPQPNKSLQANRAFQTLLDLSPPENNGYFFLDVERLQELQGTLPFPQLPDAPIISAIKSIGVTTSVQHERSLNYDIFVELPKSRRAKRLPEAQ